MEEYFISEGENQKGSKKMSVRYFYAEIDENGRCQAIIDTNAAPEDVTACFVQLESYDTSVLGKKYQSGVWEEVENSLAEEPEIGATQDPQPSNAEIKTLLQTIQAQNQTLMEALAKMTGQPLESET